MNKLRRKLKPKKLYSIRYPVSFIKKKSTKYFEHECGPDCSSLIEKPLLNEFPEEFILTSDSILMRNENPFLIPIYFEYKRRDDLENAIYLSPCGVELYNLKDIHDYLIKTDSKLSVNQFTTTSRISLFRNHSYFKVYFYKKDLSDGIEQIPIEVINEIDFEEIPKFVYVKKKIFSEEFIETTSNDYVNSCNCEDDCNNINECECQKYCDQKLNDQNNTVGYKFKYLIKPSDKIITECDSNCKCKNSCLNKVVQNGMKIRLQVYKTKKKGWGVRCLHDIPKGVFVCSYEGKVIKLNQNQIVNSNLFCTKLNNEKLKEKIRKPDKKSIDLKIDEYYKNLEKSKSTTCNLDLDSTDDLDSDTSFSDLTLSSTSSLSISDESESELKKDFYYSSKKKFKVTKLNEESNYFIDTNDYSNVARFFNHSCNSNMTIQQIYFNYSGKKFINFAFFTNQDIKAFSELTFDYLVERKFLDFQCKCKSKKCISKF